MAAVRTTGEVVRHRVAIAVLLVVTVIFLTPTSGSRPHPSNRELCLNLGDALHQAARLSMSLVTSTPSLNLIPSITFGN